MGTEPIQYLAIVILLLWSLSGNSTIDTNGTKWNDVMIAIAVWKRAIILDTMSWHGLFNLKKKNGNFEILWLLFNICYISSRLYYIFEFPGNPFGKHLPDKLVKEKYKEYSRKWDADFDNTGLPGKFSLECVKIYFWRNGNYTIKKGKNQYFCIWQHSDRCSHQCIHRQQYVIMIIVFHVPNVVGSVFGMTNTFLQWMSSLLKIAGDGNCMINSVLSQLEIKEDEDVVLFTGSMSGGWQ